MSTLQYKIITMQDAVNGKSIERVPATGGGWTVWLEAHCDNTSWDWTTFDYRVKKRSGECWADITEKGTLIGTGGSVPESVSTNCDYDGAVLRTKIKWEEMD